MPQPVFMNDFSLDNLDFFSL